MKPEVLAARDATRDLLVAFIRTLEAPEYTRDTIARKHAMRLASEWFKYNEDEIIENGPVPQNGKTVTQSFGDNAIEKCRKDLKDSDIYNLPENAASMASNCVSKTKMLGNVGNGRDEDLDMWYNWAWK